MRTLHESGKVPVRELEVMTRDFNVVTNAMLAGSGPVKDEYERSTAVMVFAPPTRVQVTPGQDEPHGSLPVQLANAV